MVKKHFKELTIVMGLILALLMVNYVFHTTNTPQKIKNPEVALKMDQSNYIPLFTELVTLSTKLILKPVNK